MSGDTAIKKTRLRPPWNQYTLSDCVSKQASQCEVYIVQRGFASMAAKRMRDRLYHAVLPIDSKILRIQGADLDKVLDSEQVKSIIASLGVGITLGKLTFALHSLRYGKIIIVTDQTTRGRHIRKQIVSFMHQYMRPLIDAGHVYVAVPQRWVGMSDEDFEAKVMENATRRILPLPRKTSLARLWLG